MFYGDDAYKEPMKQLLLQIIVYNFNVFEVSAVLGDVKILIFDNFSKLHLTNFPIFLI